MDAVLVAALATVTATFGIVAYLLVRIFVLTRDAPRPSRDPMSRREP